MLGGPSDVTSTDSTPLRPFGFGLSYTTFAYTDLAVDGEVAAGGSFAAAVRVTNTGTVAGSDVVQLYGRDLVGSVTRPVAQLLAYRRVVLEPGESALVTFDVPTTRLAFADRRAVRVVEPGDVEVWVGSHVAATPDAEAEDVQDATGGAITSARRSEKRDLPGTATQRATLVVTGDTYEVTGADPRVVTSVVA